MTNKNKEAADILRLMPKQSEAIKKAIEVLEQEPCEDAVSRERTMQIVREWFDTDAKPSELFNAIEQQPSVTPTRKAHNNNEDYAECDQFVCSNCGIELQDWHRVERDEDDGEISYHEYIFKYCPNCGAKIESEDKE